MQPKLLNWLELNLFHRLVGLLTVQWVCAALFPQTLHATTSIGLTPGTYGSRFIEIQQQQNSPDVSNQLTMGLLRSQRANGRVVNAHTFELSRRVHLNPRHSVQVGLGHIPETTIPCVRVKSVDFGRCREPELEIFQYGESQPALQLRTSQINVLWAFKANAQFTLRLHGTWGYAAYDSPAFDLTNSFLLSSRTGDTTFGDALSTTLATQPRQDRFGLVQVNGIWTHSVNLFDQPIHLSAQLSKPLSSSNTGDWAVVQFPLSLEGAIKSQITQTVRATTELILSNTFWDGEPSVFLNPLTYRDNPELQIRLRLRFQF